MSKPIILPWILIQPIAFVLSMVNSECMSSEVVLDTDAFVNQGVANFREANAGLLHTFLSASHIFTGQQYHDDNFINFRNTSIKCSIRYGQDSDEDKYSILLSTLTPRDRIGLSNDINLIIAKLNLNIDGVGLFSYSDPSTKPSSSFSALQFTAKIKLIHGNNINNKFLYNFLNNVINVYSKKYLDSEMDLLKSGFYLPNIPSDDLYYRYFTETEINTHK